MRGYVIEHLIGWQRGEKTTGTASLNRENYRCAESLFILWYLHRFKQHYLRNSQVKNKKPVKMNEPMKKLTQ